jgi:hypothetical protein
MFISKFIAKVVGEKGRWREYKARVRELPRTIAWRSKQWSGT